MSAEKRNLPASIHPRLLNKARQSGRAFNELLQYYAIERLLYRLSISEYSELFTLKGGLMFKAWGLTTLRPTVITFFHHGFLCKVYLILTYKILESN